MTTIIQKGDLVLTTKAKKVLVQDIATPEIQTTLKKMSDALADEVDGVALAAPQIGVPLRIFVVSGKMFIDAEDEEGVIPPDMVCINPRIIKLSKEKESVDEGCLSVRYWYGKVERAKKATVRAYDAKGKKFERGGSGLLAQIFQHEIDHLDGILFDSKAVDLRKIEPGNKNE